MSSLIGIRFPDGTVEYRSTEATPTPGDNLTAYGRAWIVQSVDEATMTCIVAAVPGKADGALPSSGAGAA